jgi:Xaa-Pro aminopeptidase
MGVSEHLRRTLTAMERDDIDVLLLGRESNARFVSGAARLWLSGTRPFAPGCTVVRATGDVHLLSVTDDGLPDGFPIERCYPISWNPMNIVSAVAAAPGVAGARRVGVDGMTPLFEQLLGAVLPDAELVDGEALLRAVRRVKSDDDIGAIRAAVRVALDALAAVTARVDPGTRERDLKGAFEERMGARGVATPAFEGTFCVVEPDKPPMVLVDDRRLADGDVVHLRAGVMLDGWEGALARTWSCGGALDVGSARAAFDAAVARCRPGARVADLRADPACTVDGSGMGHEELADSDILEPGMVLALEVLVDGILLGDMVLVTDADPERLTTFPDSPS